MTPSEKIALLQEMLGSPDLRRDIPTSALKRLRQEHGLDQKELARRSGISQQAISAVETGVNPLTAETARALAPVFGMSPMEVMGLHQVAALNSAALKGKLDPEPLLDGLLKLEEALPDEQAVETVVEALSEVLRRAAATWEESKGEDEKKKVGKGEPLPDESAAEFAARQKAATKSARPRRDGSGLRIDKPHGVPSPSQGYSAALKREAEVDPGVRRDGSGRRKNKPFDPRNFGQGGL